MDKCSRCSRKAEFEHPAIFCKFHWLHWWYSDDLQENEKHMLENLSGDEAVVVPLIKLIKTDLPEDQEEMERLYEQYNKWLQHED